MEAIILYVLNALPEVALALVFGYIAWKLSKRLTHIDDHLGILDKNFSDLQNEIGNVKTELQDNIGNVKTELQDNIGNVKTELQDNIGNVKTELYCDRGNVKTELCQVREELLRDITQLKIDISDIQLFLTSKFPTAVNTFSSKHSPLALNDMGIKLFDECAGKTFLDANQILLFKKLDERKPKTALDVELGAKGVLLSLINDDIFNGIKVWVYNSPSWKINDKDYVISLGDICFVLSIPLRDRYLELHPEIAR